MINRAKKLKISRNFCNSIHWQIFLYCFDFFLQVFKLLNIGKRRAILQGCNFSIWKLLRKWYFTPKKYHRKFSRNFWWCYRFSTPFFIHSYAQRFGGATKNRLLFLSVNKLQHSFPDYFFSSYAKNWLLFLLVNKLKHSFSRSFFGSAIKN